ncbi:Pyruvate dehydrogenase E1 component subunit alpha, testis-specific form, mitochondrial [Orobanche gracilis]
MAAVFTQGVGVLTSLSSVKYKNSCFSSRRSLPERKTSPSVIHCDGRLTSGSNLRNGRSVLFPTNAVAAEAKVTSLLQYDGSMPFDKRHAYRHVFQIYRVRQSKTTYQLQVSPNPEAMHELLLFEALREGLEEEMDRDPNVCVVGEDVGHYGGSYKVTKGLATKYGDLRVLDTPIAENSFTGMAIGSAMTGLRPIVEGMNMGFLLLAFNQISNNCGMLHYTSGGQFKIPIVIRGPGGVGRQLGAEHSQRLESYFQSIPGIQMVACSTPYNAKGLMKAAIRSDNPVILFEHVLLYNLKERIPDEEYVLSLEEAEMVRPGEHVTILTYSRMRYHVMQAAKILVNKGYDPEVIDIRSLKPFDLSTIGNSVKKTHRVVIVEECMRTGGIGASLTASINENFHDYLDAPIVCLSSQDVPTPYAGTLEEWTVVQPAQIVAAVEQLCR